jgi:hypothetical protein
MLHCVAILIALAGLGTTVSVVSAAQSNKCIVNGTVTYQQGPCPSEQVRKTPTVAELNAAEKVKRAAAFSAAAAKSATSTSMAVNVGFKCDGRKYCSQMTSCAEATYFLSNCAGVKMDGDGNGIPCEKQWCSR